MEKTLNTKLSNLSLGEMSRKDEMLTPGKYVFVMYIKHSDRHQGPLKAIDVELYQNADIPSIVNNIKAAILNRTICTYINVPSIEDIILHSYSVSLNMKVSIFNGLID